MPVKPKPSSIELAIHAFRRAGGILRTRDALDLGVHPRVFYHLRDTGQIEPLSRGLFRLTSLPSLAQPDLVAVSLRVRHGVICLISALAFHGLTTQIPHQVDIAIPRGTVAPRIDYPPIQHYWFGSRSYEIGIEVHGVDQVPIQVYDIEKTIIDCFRYRNRLELSTALEALKDYRSRRGFNADKLLRYSEVCRVRKTLQPYVEALI